VEALEGLIEEVDAIVLKAATELDHAHALKAGLTYYERVEKLKMQAIKTRDNALAQIEHWRDGLGLKARGLSDQFIALTAGTVLRARPRKLHPRSPRPARSPNELGEADRGQSEEWWKKPRTADGGWQILRQPQRRAAWAGRHHAP
jgi:hypothetical protein